ncbi:MAG: hypothetical protein HY912_20485 [Desulfomonile tiedjei]|uniref:Uncharacterized protein n=1 Tax=Desulfomonile tiedjei TaxID=2358 RepID=A0A9D6V8H2_9BACT|nr:hypothetical protein [Desulfomonile tiedjei]
MARLEELVNPSELLEAIRSGAMKSELLKKYRTSDQELAMMLLPLYRRADMTKEEFNNFFQGIPITGEQPQAASAEESSPAKPPEEPPSEILQTLSKLFHRKSSAEPKPAAKEETVPQEKVTSPPQEEQPQPSSPPAAIPAPAPVAAPVPVQEVIESPLDLELEEDENEIAPEEPATVSQLIKVADSATLQDLVDTIFAKITAIENRVAALEKKVDMG